MQRFKLWQEALRQSRMFRALSNDLVLICLFVGYRWAFLLPVEKRPHIFSALLYSYSHFVVGLLGLLALYLTAVKLWRLTLVLMLMLFIEDAIIYLTSTQIEAVTAIAPDQGVILSLIFACLSWTTLLRLLGLCQPGNVFKVAYAGKRSNRRYALGQQPITNGGLTACDTVIRKDEQQM